MKRPMSVALRSKLRQANAIATNKITVAGGERKQHKPKPITLPKLKCLEKTD